MEVEGEEKKSRNCKDLLSAGGFILLINVIVIAIAGVSFWYLEKRGIIEEFLEWLDSMNEFAYVVMVVLFVFPSLPGIPGMGIIFLMCGFLFQFVRGVVVASVGLQFGTFVVCAITRYFCKEKANQIVQQRGEVLLLLRDMLLNEPFKFALVMRFLPQPTGLSNVFLGILDIPLWIIQITTFLGCSVRLCSSVYLGASARSISDILYGESEWSWITILPFVVGISGMILGTIFMVSVSRKVMKQLKEHQEALETIELEEMEELEELEEPGGNEINISIQQKQLKESLEEQKNTSGDSKG